MATDRLNFPEDFWDLEVTSPVYDFPGVEAYQPCLIPLKHHQLARTITLGFPRVPLTIETMLAIAPIADNDSAAAMNTTGSVGLTFNRKITSGGRI